MLPTHHQSDGKWDKWSVNNMSKVLGLALVLLLLLQILTWNGCPPVQIPCRFAVVDNSPHLSTPLSSRSLDELPSITRTNDLPVSEPRVNLAELKQKEAGLKQKEAELEHKEAELKHKEAELEQKEAELKQKEAELKQREDELKRKEDELNLSKKQQLKLDGSPSAQSQLPPNSYFSDTDSDIWGCRQHRVDDNLTMTYRDWVTTSAFTDEQALCAAHRHAKRPMALGTPRIAFLFLTRGAIATEPVWKKFFAGHEDKYSIYVHVTDPDHQFASASLFHNRTIPSQPFHKSKISFPATVRRLLAYALLDSTTPNAWFHVVCDSSVPIRSFPFAYDYITRSDRSFVEAFYSNSRWWRENWVNNTTDDMTVPEQSMRKGEAWVTVHRRHAGLIVGDHYVFPRFKHHWYEWGFPSEIYIPTLLNVADPHSVANHSLVYVNWVNHIHRTDSPVMFDESSVSPALIQSFQNLTSNAHGFYQTDKMWNDTSEKSCVYNGVPNSPCFLFARKFSGAPQTIAKLLTLSPVLGYD